MFKSKFFSAVKIPAIVLFIVSMVANHTPISAPANADTLLWLVTTFGVSFEMTVFYEIFAYLFAVFFVLKKEKNENRVWIPYAIFMLICISKYFQ